MSLKKAWFGLIGKEITPTKKEDPRHNHTFDEEDTKHAVEMRRLRQDTARMRQKMELLEQRRELKELQDELRDDEGDDEGDEMSTDKLLMSLVLPMLNKGGAGLQNAKQPIEFGANTQDQQAPPTPTQTVLSQVISDDEIRTAIKQLPKTQIMLAKKLPKDIVFRKVTQQIPLTNEEFDRAYNILQTEF